MNWAVINGIKASTGRRCWAPNKVDREIRSYRLESRTKHSCGNLSLVDVCV